MKPITNYFKKLNTQIKHVKTPEKRKRENSITSPEQNEKKLNDEIIAKWIENEDAKLKIIKINSKEESEKINNDNVGKKIDSPSANNLNEQKVEKILKKPNCNQNYDTNKISSSSSSSSSPIKKKISLWDLPMYEDSKKSNKNSESIPELHNSNEENQFDNINGEKLDETTVKNEMKKSKLEEIVATSNKKTLGQRKISDFFL